MKVEADAQAMAVDRKTSNSTNQGEFLHNYYTFQSVHDGEYDGAVRTFVALSCELWGFLIALEDYEAQFSLCKEFNVL